MIVLTGTAFGAGSLGQVFDHFWPMDLFIAFVSWAILISWIRGRSLRQEVLKRGWTWVGDALPEKMPVAELTGIVRPLRVSNVFTGRSNGHSFLSVDCRLGEGKSARNLTLICVRTSIDPFPARDFDLSLSVERSGEWYGLHLGEGEGRFFLGRLIDVKRLFWLLDNIR